MADNVTFGVGNASTPADGTIAAADDIGGVKYQRVKVTHGADGSATDTSTAAPFPVDLANTGANATAIKVDGSAVTQPVSVASVPLPSGAATEATLAGVLTIADFDTKTGALTETAPTTDTASSGLNGRLQRIAQRITSMIALLPAALGAGGGLKVDGSGTALPVSGTVASTVADGANAVEGVTTGAAVITDATGTIQQYLRGLVKQWAAGALGVVLTAETTKVIGTVRVASGGIASGSLASGSVASGAVASGAVASGAFASGSISDGADVTQGAKADAKSTATDTTAITIMQVLKQISFSIQAAAASVAGTLTVAAHAVTNAGTFAVQETTMVAVSTASLTALASSASSAQLLASTAGRKGLLLTNTDANAVLIKYGTTASATSFTVRLVTNAYWEMPQPIYTGRIDAIWEGDGSGSLYATEL